MSACTPHVTYLGSLSPSCGTWGTPSETRRVRYKRCARRGAEQGDPLASLQCGCVIADVTAAAIAASSWCGCGVGSRGKCYASERLRPQEPMVTISHALQAVKSRDFAKWALSPVAPTANLRAIGSGKCDAGILVGVQSHGARAWAWRARRAVHKPPSSGCPCRLCGEDP